MSQNKILVVDDEPSILNFLFEFLSVAGFNVFTATNGSDAMTLCKAIKPDLILLDVVMPGINGFQTCTNIRESSSVPIIFVSARNSTQDRIMGLACGGDDYMAKPFDCAELILRVKAVLKRTGGQTGVTPGGDVVVQGITINQDNRTVKKKQAVIELTTKEFDLLWLLISHPHRVFTREQLVYQIWNTEFFEDAAVNMLVKRLRGKIEDNPAKPNYIKTIRGVGYKFEGEHC